MLFRGALESPQTSFSLGEGKQTNCFLFPGYPTLQPRWDSGLQPGLDPRLQLQAFLSLTRSNWKHLVWQE